jgi:hypothetical protein
MEQLLGEDLFVAGVKVNLNDILMFAKSLEDHLALLDEILTKL